MHHCQIIKLNYINYCTFYKSSWPKILFSFNFVHLMKWVLFWIWILENHVSHVLLLIYILYFVYIYIIVNCDTGCITDLPLSLCYYVFKEGMIFWCQVMRQWHDLLWRTHIWGKKEHGIHIDFFKVYNHI